MRRYIFAFVGLFLFNCSVPEPRRPIKVKTSSFVKESAERNKALLEKEQKLIQDHIAKDTAHSYITSANSSWYFYEIKNEESSYLPQTDDVVTLTYDLATLHNDIIYSRAEIDTVVYVVDKQNLFPGLRNSVKLLKEKETATFLFPSSMAYGYHGDNGKIGPSLPIRSTISIINIEKQQDSIPY